jgi:hypothetical protein
MTLVTGELPSSEILQRTLIDVGVVFTMCTVADLGASGTNVVI